MASRYGALWTNQHGPVPCGLDEAEWGEAILGLTEDQIRAGFHTDLDRGSDFPPSSAKFVAMCSGESQRNPADNVVRTYISGHCYTPPPKRVESDKARAVADRELSAMCEKLGIDRSALTEPRS